jgi:hypothetical protein
MLYFIESFSGSAAAFHDNGAVSKRVLPIVISKAAGAGLGTSSSDVHASTIRKMIQCVLGRLHYIFFTIPFVSLYRSLLSGHSANPSLSNSSLCPYSLIHPVCLAGFPITSA